MTADVVDQGVALLTHLERDELELPEVMSSIEAVTSSPNVQRRILEAADDRGVIDRDQDVVRIVESAPDTRDLEDKIISKDGHFECRRCGHSLSTGYWLRTGAGELGPFGSTCIQKVAAAR